MQQDRHAERQHLSELLCPGYAGATAAASVLGDMAQSDPGSQDDDPLGLLYTRGAVMEPTEIGSTSGAPVAGSFFAAERQ